jgi:ATP-dependent RNA helicase DDX52/ROK1
MCVAPTGSGKTLSYVLPTLVRLGDPARALRERQGEGEGQGVGGEGIGIRSLILVPTHDLAIQIEGVVKAVTRGRGWRVMVLTKATQKAVCDSAPGAGSGDSQGQDQDESGEGEEEEEEIKGKTPLGIDVLIATPERLHHLFEEGKLSLAEYVHPPRPSFHQIRA